MTDRRDFNDPVYKKWRKAVYVRDRWKCRMPGCSGVETKLNAHHVKRWSSFPELRFVVGNGISLCRSCHEKVKGHEEEYESLFLQLVGMGRSDSAMQLLMMRYAKKHEPEGET